MALKKVDIHSLRLAEELEYSIRVKDAINRLENDMSFFKLRQDHLDENYYSLISSSIEVTDHYEVEFILNNVKRNLDLDLSIRVMLFQSSIFNVMCMPRYESRDDMLLIFVSQHFFNNLTNDEQTGIIGHEIAHYVFGYLEIPVHEILTHSFSLHEVEGLKIDLIRFSQLSEISADIVGLAANNFNHKAYASAILKHSTGLFDTTHTKFNISMLIDQTRKQYQALANDHLFVGEKSTHPLTPLRVEIINAIVECQITRHFGVDLDDAKHQKVLLEFNDMVFSKVLAIYPEMNTEHIIGHEVLTRMALAVAMSDGYIDEKEIISLGKVLQDSSKSTYINLAKEFKDLDDPDATLAKMKKLIVESIDVSKKNHHTQQILVPIIRCLLVVAASNGVIEKSELDCIFEYAKNFDFTRRDIVIILRTHNLF
ncbi:MAG: hypothetical protein U9N86_00835 [Bacteroidota bacterium]|nr:hypothetical protein [Bacteroidota bacterium]